ncbi:MAG: hypothetical protein GXO15_00370 [Crenarchaeota archaeon]|nr:hypothetical protein [Thermoproteota archaeon]
MPPIAPGGGAQAGRGGQEPQGPVAVLRHALSRLQERLHSLWPRIRGMGTCSREFLEVLDELEELADRELVYRGFDKVPAAPVSRRGEQNVDLVVALYRVGDIIVEVGLKGLNRCGIVEALTGGEPPRVYARLHLGGGAVVVLEAEEAAQRSMLSYYI